MRKWGGRLSQRLVALTLHTKGTVCHLCGFDGANSADHEPPRSVLVAQGVPNPDDLRYLWPAHRSCNYARQDRPLSDALRAALRARYARRLEVATAPPPSPRFTKSPLALLSRHLARIVIRFSPLP